MSAEETHGSDEHHAHGGFSHPHVLSVKFLVGVFAALIVLTILTVFTARIDLGELNIFVALLIASVKASLVALFFMHLKWDKPFNAVVLLTSIGLVALFLGIATLDMDEAAPSRKQEFTDAKMKLLREARAKKLKAEGKEWRYHSQIEAEEHADDGEDEGGSKSKAGKSGPTKAAGLPADEVKSLAAWANDNFGPIERAPGNPLKDPKVALGQMLYFEKRLSKNHDISCATCHDLDKFGIDPRPGATSAGHKGQLGTRNSPTVYNAHFSEVGQFWDGRSETVETQAIEPIRNPVEMASTPDRTLATLRSMPEYVTAFEKAFPGEGLSYANVGNAIGAFERHLVTPGRFDEFMMGKHDALSDAEVRGLKVFKSVGCFTCHVNNVSLGGSMMQKLGLQNTYDTKDQGLFQETGKRKDRKMFKTSQLRNIAETGPYLHDGSIETLEEIVDLMTYYQLNKKLNKTDKANLVAFMKALTGDMDDPTLKRLRTAPSLPASTDSTPKADPN